MTITPARYLDTISLRRRGYLVELSFGRTTTNITKMTATEVIGTLPVDYRPRVTEERMISATLNGIAVYISLNANGSISIRVSENINAGTPFYASIQYIRA